MDSIVVLYNSPCKDLANKISNLLRTCYYDDDNLVSLGSFANTETTVKINKDIRYKTVYVIASFGSCYKNLSVNDLFMEIVLLCNAIKNAGAKKTILINTCFGYARQDRISSGEKKSLSSGVVGKILQDKSLDIYKIYTIDIHCEQIQNVFMSGRHENISVASLMAKYIYDYLKTSTICDSICIVAPDQGASIRNEEFRIKFNDYGKCDSDFASIKKKRSKAGKTIDGVVKHEIQKMTLLSDDGTYKNKLCIIVDDICDSGGTLCEAAKLLMDKGAGSVIACITHPILSGLARQRITNSDFTKIFTTDSLGDFEPHEKVELVSLESLLAILIKNINKLPIETNFISNKKNNNFLSFRNSPLGGIYLSESEIEKHEDFNSSMNNINVGILSNSEIKIHALRNFNKTWNINSVIDTDYKSLVEQPIGLNEIRECILHRYNEGYNKRFKTECINKYNTLFKPDIIIGIESGLVLNNGLLTEITQCVIIDPLSSEYTFLDFGTISSSEPNIIEKAKIVINNKNRDITLGSLLCNEYGLNDKNWQLSEFNKDRSQLILESLEQNLEIPEIVDNIKKRLYLRKEIQKIVPVYNDFPIKKVNFQNIYPILRNPNINSQLIDHISNICKSLQITHICSLASRGYLLASPIAYKLNIQHIPITKLGKLPDNKVYKINYKKEYGEDSLQIENDAFINIKEDFKIMVIDDLLATGGSLKASYNLIKRCIPNLNKKDIYAFTLLYVPEIYKESRNMLLNYYNDILIFC